jgi:putative peptide zinc metalloprotease protein
MLQTRHSDSSTSFDRPIPYRRRQDLVIAWIKYRGVKHAVIKDPLALKYHQLSPEQYSVLDRLDGERSLKQIRTEVQTEFPTEHFSLMDIQGLVIDLQEKQLLTALRLGQGPALLKAHRDNVRKKIGQTLRNPLTIQLPGWDPERVLQAMMPFVKWMFYPKVIVTVLSCVAFALLFLSARFGEIQKSLPEFQRFFGWPNLVYLWVALAIIKVIHEFGHGLSCKYYGSECHSIGVMLLVFSPTMYCDVTDSWMLHNKWQRIMIGAAGMYFEMILSTIALMIWWNTEPGMFHYLCLNTFFVSTVSTVIFNANPLLKYDGYYMLSDLLEIPNLRQKADQITQRILARLCLGIDLPSPAFLPDHGRFWFFTYVVASAIYRWMVFAGIITFFYTVLKPYRLQSLGILMAIVTILLSFGGFVWNTYKLMSQPRRDSISKPRLAVTVAFLGVCAYLVLFLPFPWYVEAPFTVEPAGVVHIYNSVPGFVDSQSARPGESVEAGKTILTLVNPEIDLRVSEAEVQFKAAQAEYDAYTLNGQAELAAVSQEKLDSATKQLALLKEQQSRLVITAPAAGTVVAPPRQGGMTVEQMRERMPSWSGTPLTDRNIGAFLEPQTHISSIAPGDKLQAVLVMDQTEREVLSEDRSVRLKLEGLPTMVWDGKITEISHRHLEFAPSGLSNQFQGPLVTVPDEQGRQKLSSVTYQAIVPLEGDPRLLRSGMRGTARVHLFDRSLGQWVWRYLQTMFQFRL